MTMWGAKASARAGKLSLAAAVLMAAFVVLFAVTGSPFASTRTADTRLADAIAPADQAGSRQMRRMLSGRRTENCPEGEACVRISRMSVS